MNGLLTIIVLFVAAIAITALITRFSSSESAPQSEAEKQRKREAARRSAVSNRKVMTAVTSGVLVILAIIAVASLLCQDQELRRLGLYFSGAVALPMLVLWGKSRDDGFYPELRKKPDQPPEPVTDHARNDDSRPT
jgi:hypothetical protein